MIGSSLASCGNDSCAGAAWFPVKADCTSVKAGFQGLGHIDAGETVAVRLEFEHLRADHLFRLTPVGAHAHGLASYS